MEKTDSIEDKILDSEQNPAEVRFVVRCTYTPEDGFDCIVEDIDQEQEIELSMTPDLEEDLSDEDYSEDLDEDVD
jgi:hypothetical protein